MSVFGRIGHVSQLRYPHLPGCQNFQIVPIHEIYRFWSEDAHAGGSGRVASLVRNDVRRKHRAPRDYPFRAGLSIHGTLSESIR